MLLINRKGPPEFHQLFLRVSRQDMIAYLDDRSEGHWSGGYVESSLQDNTVLAMYITQVYADLGREINNKLFDHGNTAIGRGRVRAMYSSLDDEWVRGNIEGSMTWSFMEDAVNKYERDFAAKILEPWPDLARKFDENIF